MNLFKETNTKSHLLIGPEHATQPLTLFITLCLIIFLTFGQSGCSDNKSDPKIDATLLDAAVDAGFDADIADLDGGDDAGNGGDDDGGDDAGNGGDDPDSPRLRIRAFDITHPSTLITMFSDFQESTDDEEIIHLMTIDSIEGDGNYDGLFGRGVAEAGESTYSFVDSKPLVYTITGNDFITDEGGAEVAIWCPHEVEDEIVYIPIVEAVLSGTFNTADRDSIGEQLTYTPPTEWNTGGSLTGLITVDESKTSAFHFGSLEVTLCAFLAYGHDIVKLAQDPNCAADPATFTHPPDGLTTNGDPAWIIEADYAATSIDLMD